MLRILRSISQGFLGIILALYLALLGYDAVALGTLLACSAITAALIPIVTGVLSDRFGRKILIALISLLRRRRGRFRLRAQLLLDSDLRCYWFRWVRVRLRAARGVHFIRRCRRC